MRGVYLLLLASLFFSAGLAINEIDYLEFDTSYALQGEIIHVSGDVYAIAYRDSASDGRIKTVSISSDGNIAASTIDELEFDIYDCANPSFIHVSGNVYAVAYTTSGSDGNLTTFTIDSNGLISDSTIDFLEFDTIQAINPHIRLVSGNVYAIAYSGNGNDGYVSTVSIDGSGIISDAVIDSYEFDTSNGQYPRLIKVYDTVYAVAYTATSNKGKVVTFSISNSGVITKSIIDSLEFENTYCINPVIINALSNYYAVAYTGVDSDGFLSTFSISNEGSISTSVIDSLEFDSIQGLTPRLLYVRDNFFVLANDGSDNDGWAYTVVINNGLISDSPIDSFEFDTINGQTPDLLLISGDIFIIAYSGNGNDGYIKSFDLNPQYCGDSYCASSESYSNCPQDCCESDCTATNDAVLHYACNGYNACSILTGCDAQVTGYKYCVDSNTYATCPITQTDCSSGLFCNNGVCSSCSSVCDASCNGGVPCYGIDPDCDASGTATLNCCGNGKCSIDESCSSCPTDCGQCQITYGVCGNGLCELDYNATYSETCSNCLIDCGACPVGVCDSSTCSGSCGTCKENQCKNNACVCDYIINCCGNNICDTGETYGTCARDCPPTSIEVNIIEPLSDTVFMKGDKFLMRVNLTFNSNIIGIGANTTVRTSFGTFDLTDPNLDGMYEGNITIPSNATVGSLILEVTARKTVSGTASRNVILSNSLINTLILDKESYVKSERISVSGNVINARSEPVNATIYLVINNQTITGEAINGQYYASYLTSLLDNAGNWTVLVRSFDNFSNEGTVSRTVLVNEPGVGTYYTINILSPPEGAVMRGQTITVTAEVKFNNELVSNALVSFKKPDNTYQELSEISTGRYSSSYKINNEELVSDWILEVIATKEPLMGTTSIDLVIIPASISIELVSPSKSQVSVGETLKLTVNAKYPDGSPVDIPEINSTINNETIILKRISAGVYEANYIVEENASNVGIKLLVNDASNNTGTSSINFSVSGVSFEHYFRAYPYITYPLISGFLISIIAIYLFFHKSKSLNNLSLNKKRLINQKKETQTDYFVNKTISNEQYNKLIAKLDSDIDVIDKKIKSLMKVKKN